MKLYIISWYLILVGICRAVQTGSICRSYSIFSGRNVIISGYNNDIGQCECQITNNNDPHNTITIINIAHYPVSCNYSLFYWLRGYNNKIESNHKNSTFSLNFNGTLFVRIENKLIGSGEPCSSFSVTTKSPDYNISASCENLTKTIETTTTLSTTTLSTTIIPITTLSRTTVPTYSIPVSTTPSISQTVDTVSTGDITNTRSSSTTMTTTDQGVARAASNHNSLLPIILGCSVGGTVLIILLIVIVGCVLFRRHKSGNSHHGEMVEIKNNINVSSDSIPNNNNQHGTKYMAEMEIIPNDLYQSSDSLFDDPNVSGQHEHVPEQLEHGTKDKPVMEIIPNESYQSLDSLADDLQRLKQHEIVPEQHAHIPGQLEHVPYTNSEYALVNKKPKKVPNRMKINQNPNKVQADYENIEKEKKTIKLEIDRIVGPKGDNYTLVNKC